MNFTEVIVAVFVGWFLGVVPTWLILARTLPWLDYRMLPKPKTVSQSQQLSPAPVGTAQSLPTTQPISQIV